MQLSENDIRIIRMALVSWDGWDSKKRATADEDDLCRAYELARTLA